MCHRNRTILLKFQGHSNAGMVFITYLFQIMRMMGGNHSKHLLNSLRGVLLTQIFTSFYLRHGQVLLIISKSQTFLTSFLGVKPPLSQYKTASGNQLNLPQLILLIQSLLASKLSSVLSIKILQLGYSLQTPSPWYPPRRCHHGTLQKFKMEEKHIELSSTQISNAPPALPHSGTSFQKFQLILVESGLQLLSTFPESTSPCSLNVTQSPQLLW